MHTARARYSYRHTARYALTFYFVDETKKDEKITAEDRPSLFGCVKVGVDCTIVRTLVSTFAPP